MKSKNILFNTGDNQAADDILILIESLDILSDKFKTKIQNIVLAMMSALRHNDIPTLIEDLDALMSYTTIFSDTFRNNINRLLTEAYKFEVEKQKISKK